MNAANDNYASDLLERWGIPMGILVSVAMWTLIIFTFCAIGGCAELRSVGDVDSHEFWERQERHKW